MPLTASPIDIRDWLDRFGRKYGIAIDNVIVEETTCGQNVALQGHVIQTAEIEYISFEHEVTLTNSFGIYPEDVMQRAVHEIAGIYVPDLARINEHLLEPNTNSIQSATKFRCLKCQLAQTMNTGTKLSTPTTKRRKRLELLDFFEQTDCE